MRPRLVRLACLLSLAIAVLAAAQDAARPPEDLADQLIRLNNLGIAELARFKEAAALDAFRQALGVDPGYAVAQINLGIALLAAADYPGAEAALRRGLDLRPGEPYAQFNLGLVYKLQGKTADAIAAFEAVQRVDPDDPDTLYQLGTLYARERRPEKAIPVFQRAVELAPQNVSAYYGLGQALLQTGNAEEGKKYLELSQKLKAQSDLNVAVGTRYGEQGKYSYALEDDRVRALARGPAPAPIPVKFTPVDAAAAGIGFRHSAGAKERAGGAALSCADGSGAAAEDIDADGDLDLLLVDCAAEGGGDRLYRNDGGLKFTDITAGSGIGAAHRGMAAVFGDYDNDRNPDLALTGLDGVRLLRSLGGGKFEEVGGRAGVAGVGPAAGAAWADVDHDGDLDLYVVRRAGAGEAAASPRNLLFRNLGDGRFSEAASELRLDGGGAPGLGLVFTDYDNDRDIDLVLPKSAGAWQLLSNDRTGTFTDVAASRGLGGPPAQGVAAADFDKDGFVDLAATGPGGLALLRNLSAGSFRPEAEPAAIAARRLGKAGGAAGVTFLDFDNDGYLDLAAAAAEPGGAAVVLLRNAGEGRLLDATADAGLDRLKSARGRALLAADLDGDRDLDLLLTQAGGPVLVLRNDGGSARQALSIDPLGKSSNRSGIGVKVEVKAGRLWQKLEVASGSGYLSGGPTRLHLGLGDRTSADTVRLLWPSGILQDEIDVAAAPSVLEELDRKGSSCPILYAWDGARFGFVTDFLGGSAVGYRVAAAAFNTPDTDEYVKVRGDQLRVRDGRLELRMVNQLEEVIYVDRARLLAVDHPEAVAVYPNERLLAAPPFPPFELFAVGEERELVAASDDRGNDLRDALRREDRRWPDSFPLLPFKGYAEEHALVLDPGPLPAGARVVLLADAWIDYADSTSNLAAAQAGLSLLPPRLEVVGAGGVWTTALPQMGFPAGLPKTLAVELTGLFRRPDDPRIRIVTNMRIYWDRIRFGLLNDAAAPRVTPVEAAAADLRFLGYPRPVSADGKAPFGYDYAAAAPRAGWKDFEGAFTRYGDVRGLLGAVDDRYVILRHGDEVALAFDAAALPPLPGGWVRDYLLYADGFGKDMDMNSARPDRVEPLPYHAMTSYPPPPGEMPPLDEAWLEWIRSSNTRRTPGEIPALP